MHRLTPERIRAWVGYGEQLAMNRPDMTAAAIRDLMAQNIRRVPAEDLMGVAADLVRVASREITSAAGLLEIVYWSLGPAQWKGGA